MMNTQDWILLSILFYVCAGLAVGVYAFAVRRASLFEPIVQYLFFISIFSLPLPIRAWMTMEIEGDISPYLSRFSAWLPLALVLTALSLPVFAIGYYSNFARNLGKRIPLLAPREAHGTWAGVLVLVVVSCVLIYSLTKEIGGIVPFLLLGYKSSAETFGRGYLAVGFPWLIVAMVAILDCYAVSRHKLALLGFVVLLLVNVVIHVVTGNRGMIMYFSVVLGIFINFRIRYLPLRVLLPVAIAGFMALNVAGLLRGSNYDSLGDLVERMSISSRGVTDEKSGFFYTLTTGEFIVPFETLPQMIGTVGVTEWLWMGWSYLRSPVYLIPSIVFADRPPGLSIWYTSVFYPGQYAYNEGRAFFFLAEGYLNFGPFGVLLIAAVWGVFWGALHRWMQRGRDTFGTVLLYALVVGFMFRCIAGDFATLVAGITQQSVAAVVLILVVANLVNSRPRLRASGSKGL